MADLNADDYISSSNSSTSTLGVSAAFTGTGEEITDYEAVTVNVISDVASATGGLSLQFSSNNSNWDHTIAYSVTASVGLVVHAPRQARYFRVVYTNGTSGQSSFRLQTIFNVNKSFQNTYSQSTTATLSNVSQSASSVTLASANSKRIGFTVYNDTSADLYIKFGTTASTTSFSVRVPKATLYEMARPIYIGRLDGIWSSSGSGNARITELT